MKFGRYNQLLGSFLTHPMVQKLIVRNIVVLGRGGVEWVHGSSQVYTYEVFDKFLIEYIKIYQNVEKILTACFTYLI